MHPNGGIGRPSAKREGSPRDDQCSGPFAIDEVMARVKELKRGERTSDRGMKQGKFFGQFSRLLVRMGAKLGTSDMDSCSRRHRHFTSTSLLDRGQLNGLAEENHRIQGDRLLEVPAMCSP